MSGKSLVQIWRTEDGSFIDKTVHPTSGTISVTVVVGTKGYTERFESYEYERADQYTAMLVGLSQAKELMRK